MPIREKINLSIEVIENGYLVHADIFENGDYHRETWYSIHPDEVKQKLDRYL